MDQSQALVNNGDGINYINFVWMTYIFIEYKTEINTFSKSKISVNKTNSMANSFNLYL